MKATLYIPDVNGCWNWRGSLHAKGYARYWDGQRQHQAHRFMYATRIGPIPKGAQVKHTCGNRRCVNPAHLILVLPRPKKKPTSI